MTLHRVPYANFDIRPVTKRSTKNETAPTATALLLGANRYARLQREDKPLSRVLVWFEELQAEIRESFAELPGQPWTRCKPADQKNELCMRL